MTKMKLYIYLDYCEICGNVVEETHDMCGTYICTACYEEMEKDNQDIFEAYQTECDITDHYDRLVASNCFSSTKLQPWTVIH